MPCLARLSRSQNGIEIPPRVRILQGHSPKHTDRWIRVMCLFAAFEIRWALARRCHSAPQEFVTLDSFETA